MVRPFLTASAAFSRLSIRARADGVLAPVRPDSLGATFFAESPSGPQESGPCSNSQGRKQRMNQPSIDWQATLAQHDRWLRTVILARVQEPQAVDEVLQEVALAVVRQAAPLADPTRLAPWLYRLAVLQSLLYRRRCGRARRLRERYAAKVVECGLFGGPQPPLDPLGWLIAEERRGLVREAISGLPPRDAEILLLKYTENWSYFQIAAHLGLSHSAVEARLHRARARLRQSLAALEVIEVER
jgi:RNA polymerase sigma factor (sigma-70 family)